MAVRALTTLLGFKAIGLARELRDSDRLVACALLDHYNRKTGQCDPSLETLARLLGKNRRSIIRATSRLESLGFFRKVRHGGNFHRNLYEPVWLRFEQVEVDWKRRRAVGRGKAGRENKSPSQCQVGHGSGDNGATQTCTSNLSYVTTSHRTSAADPDPLSEPPGNKKLGKGTACAGAVSRRPFVPHRTSSSDAARMAAQRRWDADLLATFGSHQGIYSAIIGRIDEKLITAATDAELNYQGGGLRFLVETLGLPSPETRSDA